MKEPVRVRPACLQDCERIATLMRQLGYDVASEHLAERLQHRAPRREVLVATDDGGEVIGWAAICADEPFVEGLGAHLEGLVVEDSSRSRGVGERLLSAAESWARDRHCSEMRVQSNVVRTRAHSFYARHGYATIKSQYQLRKRL